MARFSLLGYYIIKCHSECHSLHQSETRTILVFDQLEKHRLRRGHWDLAWCQRFQRRSWKCLSQSDARAAILFFRSARKTQTWPRMLWSCFLSSFIEFHSGEKSKMSQPIRGRGGHLFKFFPIGQKKTKLGRGHWDLASCRVSLNSVQRFHRRGRKCPSQSEVRAAILFFRSARKTQTW